MPIWFEVVVLMLVGYFAGIGIGWGLWGRTERGDIETDGTMKDSQ